MFVYHRTNGDNGEILVEMFGNFLGFIVNLGRPDQWAAYTRELELIGDGYGSGRRPRPLAFTTVSASRRSRCAISYRRLQSSHP